MTYTKTLGKTLNLNEDHYSDGRELIPAEVQANIRHDGIGPIEPDLSTGYTKDDEGLINNHAIEPDISPVEYPSKQQQQRYILMGVGATLFVLMLILAAFVIS